MCTESLCTVSVILPDIPILAAGIYTVAVMIQFRFWVSVLKLGR